MRQNHQLILIHIYFSGLRDYSNKTYSPRPLSFKASEQVFFLHDIIIYAFSREWYTMDDFETKVYIFRPKILFISVMLQGIWDTKLCLLYLKLNCRLIFDIYSYFQKYSWTLNFFLHCKREKSLFRS